MKLELLTFLEKYALHARRKLMIVLIAYVVISSLIIGITFTGQFETLSTPYLYFIVFLDIILIGYLLFKVKQVSIKIDRIKQILTHHPTSVKTIQLYKKGKKDSYDGISYFMKISIKNTFGQALDYYLDEFNQNEHLFNEGITTFSKAYPEVKIMHFAE